MPPIFSYLNFRDYLKDYFKEQKSKTPCFSYQYFANKAGFANKGFIYNIINGSKQLSNANIFKLCSAMNLTTIECDYFQTLVAYNQASTAREQAHYFQQLSSKQEQTPVCNQTQVINRDQYAYYSEWYHSAIRSLIGMHPAKNDVKWLSRQLNPPISGWEIRRSIKLLLRLGLLRKEGNGTFSLSNPAVATGPEAKAAGLLDFYQQHLDLAKNALQNVPRTKRRFEGITLGISRKSYEKICAELALCTEKIISIAREDTAPDSVYQCMMQLYPLTKGTTKELPDEPPPL